ncbi:MAG: hypothetical protein CVU05_09445 [Bacteroidetes bacterium HGW-Bacteroidetes-21]|jgi:hypothetical protein|nr:MAG: hypothetical protein CVU05_09445 [Bacteroidetes bacterium HGW-Bacteroidetes-21]
MKIKTWLLIAFVVISIQSKLYSQTSGNYVILTTLSDTTDAYYDAVRIIRDYRNAEVITYNPANVNAVLTSLTIAQPRYVAIVLKPIELDINLVRRILIMSTNLDSDPFSDFSYGFITGATAQDAVDFVNNIIYAETNHIEDYPLNVGGYAASSLNFVYPANGDYMQYLNPPSANCIYMETNDNNSGHDFFMNNTGYMQYNKVLDIGHNGDPHMLWLFEGGNTDPVPAVWNYDPAKIEDPAYVRVGLSSYDIATLDLYPAVAFNGACHSGEPKKVMIEGDIAATFGDTQGYVQFYTMSDTFSFALAILKTGITGYFAPCGANNANDQGEDMYNAFLYNEPLGDIHKRSNDGVVMGFLGNRPNLKIYTQGEYFYGCDVLLSGNFNPANYSGACYMLGGKANRIYFGDPLFNPYQNNHSTQLNLASAAIDSVNETTLNINLTYYKPDASVAYFPAWDKFHFGNTRIYLPVDLPEYCQQITGFSVLSASGAYDLVIHAEEDFDSKKILHIEVDIPNDMYDEIDYDISFQVNYLNTVGNPVSMINDDPGLSVFPNPGNGDFNLLFDAENVNDFTLRVVNTLGQVKYSEDVKKANKSVVLPLNLSELAKGVYQLQLIYNDKTMQKTIIVGEH